MTIGNSLGREPKRSRFYLVSGRFLKDPKPYVLQSLMAVAAIAVILYFVTFVTHAAIIAALGSSAFIVFAMPRYFSAEPRRLVGGHVIGLVCGLAAFYLFSTGPIAPYSDHLAWVRVIGAGFSIGLAVFLMPVFDAEHPPAAGTALGIAAGGWTYQTVLFIVIFAVLLSVVRWLLLPRLKDLV
jgi:CBS-domain-containing membrane protein